MIQRPWLVVILSLALNIDTSRSLQLPAVRPWKKTRAATYEYDLIIIGAGAAGLFASGASSSMLGRKTALVDYNKEIGGDCTNAACVPSKALRSMARQASASATTASVGTITGRPMQRSSSSNQDWIKAAERHIAVTVNAVRSREDSNEMQERNPNLDIVLVNDCRFVGPHSLQVVTTRALQSENAITTTVLTSRRFLICTGASPVVPVDWEQAASSANLPLWTYRSLLRPDDSTFFQWLSSQQQSSSSPSTHTSSSSKRLLIVGGGATAVELGQSVARLLQCMINSNNLNATVEIELVAPAILPTEDATLQESALKLLCRAGIKCRLGVKLNTILPDRSVVLSDNSTLPPVDGMIVCIGRSPASSLSSLDLEKAGIAWDPKDGVLVHGSSLQSTTAPHVSAAGDCSSAVTDRSQTAAHAAWNGFYAVGNTAVPWFLRFGGRSVHPTVPRVIYSDPELVCVGLTRRECVQKYGVDGYDSVYVPEEGSDRADMERLERDTDVAFVELRATKSGRIIGCSACGPAAAELANSMGMAITNHLTVRDVAKSIHSYPSHGYLLHRVALAMALSNVHGLLASCGPVGEIVGNVYGVAGTTTRLVRGALRLPNKRRKMRQQQREWETQGTSRVLYLYSGRIDESTSLFVDDDNVKVVSFLDAFSNFTLRDEVDVASRQGNESTSDVLVPRAQAASWLEWRRAEPQ